MWGADPRSRYWLERIDDGDAVWAAPDSAEVMLRRHVAPMRHTYRGKHHPATGHRAAGRRTTLLTPRCQRTGAPAACPGQGLIEFALVVPLFLLLLFAIIDFGILFEHRITLDNAARSGARWATTHPTAWSNAATAPSNTIEGQVQIAGGTSAIPNSDS